jgi:hypothetical protein
MLHWPGRYKVQKLVTRGLYSNRTPNSTSTTRTSQVKVTHLASEILEVRGPLNTAERAEVERGFGGHPDAEPDNEVVEAEEVAEEGHGASSS